MAKREIIVIGASAGGLSPLKEIVSQLPSSFGGSIFVVMHLAPQSDSKLPEILSNVCRLPAKWAIDGESIKTGTIYVASPNQHLIVDPGEMRVLFGPKECRARPSIDVLFRSAAASHTSQVIGVILSGKLDDGTHGMEAIKRCGGVAIVLNPSEAEESEMPSNVLRAMGADYVLAANEIADILVHLTEESVMAAPVAESIRIENKIAKKAMLADEEAAREPVVVSCPECGGDLQLLSPMVYRCRLGHALGAYSLLNTQQDQLEQALWIAIRVLSDRKRVLRNLADDYRIKSRFQLAESTMQTAAELDQESAVLRNVLQSLSNNC